MLYGEVLHVVGFTLKDGVERGNPQAQQAARITAEHPLNIEHIESWCCGWDVSGRAGAFDFILVSTFASGDAYHAFQSHPDHERGRQAWSEVATWRVADVNTVPA